MRARFTKLWAGVVDGVKRRASVSVSTGLAAVAMAIALFPAQASAETRSLRLYYVHTGEKAEIPFKRNGRYLPDGLKKLNVFLRDWRRNEPTKMDPRLFDLIWQVYQSSGSREYINVVSAYRSPATNAMLRSRSSRSGVAKKSQHMLGHAMDFYIPGVPLAKLRAIGMRYQIGGVGYYPRSGSPFVHMDVGNVRHWPRMSRRELLALFPDGKTVHLPSDGKPLPGYQQALAMVERNKASGGGVMMASNSSSPRRSKSLFGALFGGGADEEEDNGDTATPARPARVAPVRQAPAAVPEAPVQQAPRETMVAALPPREAPVPMQAPRPEAGLEAQAPEGTPVAAFNVPIPAQKPAMAPQDEVALAAAQQLDPATPSPLMNGFVPIPATRPDSGPENANAQLLAAAVVPGQRPTRPGEQVASEQDAIAAMVQGQQDDAALKPGEPAALPLPGEAPRGDTQLAMLSKKDEIGELIGPPEDDFDDMPVTEAKPVAASAPVRTTALAPVEAPVAQTPAAQAPATHPAARTGRAEAVVGKAVDTGVKTTAKGARRVAKASSRPRPVVQPVSMPASEVAMSTESVSRVVPVTNPVLRNEAMRSAPAMVYTAGFQQGDLPSERANQFHGNAVTFLTVAKFTATN